MTITRLEHACLVVEEHAVRVLVDLGSWTSTLPNIPSLDAVLITHEHQDHFDEEKLVALLTSHPNAVVVTHQAVGEKLAARGITYTELAPGESTDINGVTVTSYGSEHAIIYGTTSPCRNTGFLIANRLFIPGDALHDIPPVSVEILALPTGGPWMKVSEAIDYATALKPRVAFPVHDAMYTETYRLTSVPRWMTSTLSPLGIEFSNLQPGESKEF